MYEIYNTLLERYLIACKSKFDINKPYNNLEECCSCAERFKYELLGMINLMEKMKVITCDQNEAEWDRILKAFSTHDLFNCYKEKDGTIMVWSKITK